MNGQAVYIQDVIIVECRPRQRWG